MMRADGADVIDLGCLPDSPFPHLEASIAALHADGVRVSVDSFNAEELSRANRAGADFLFSLSETTIAIADEGPAVPILISAGAADMASLDRVIDIMIAKGKTLLRRSGSRSDPLWFRSFHCRDTMTCENAGRTFPF